MRWINSYLHLPDYTIQALIAYKNEAFPDGDITIGVYQPESQTWFVDDDLTLEKSEVLWYVPIISPF